jgi:protein MpaA
MAHTTRFNARGVDLNRNFSTANRINSSEFGMQALSEPESLVISELIRRYNPNRIVSIHQPFGCIDYDGPAKTLAVRMAEYCRLPVNKLGGLPGSLGSYTGIDLGIPTITLELPGPKGENNFDTALLWKNYGNCLLAALVYPHRLR